MERQTGVPAEQQPQRQRQPQSDRVSSSQGASSSSSERDTGINKLISKVSKKGGGMTRSSLKSEWEDLERSIYETEIAGKISMRFSDGLNLSVCGQQLALLCMC